jgi:uncharacterized protein with HEPN domain
MNHRNKITLEKIRDEAALISQLIAGIDVDSFVNDEIIKRAATMSLINIGELTNALTDDLKNETPHIQWSQIRRTRDKVAHHYIDLDPRITWETISKSVPELKSQIEELLAKDT